jgi:AbrB family looped-hinge helix DNA binding protein
MRITSKGQVTIPAAIREKAGLLPNTEVEFTMDGDAVRLRRRKPRKGVSRGQAIVDRLRGTATRPLSTEAIMAMTRGE